MHTASMHHRSCAGECGSVNIAPLAATQALVSVSTIGTQDGVPDEELAQACKAELAEWFGQVEIDTWELLRVYRIPFAQPNQARRPWPACVLLCVSSGCRDGAPHHVPAGILGSIHRGASTLHVRSWRSGISGLLLRGCFVGSNNNRSCLACMCAGAADGP